MDVGLYQYDSIRFDLERTLREVRYLYANSGRIIEEEKAFLEKENVKLVVSDIASLPFEAAQALGIPAIGVGNFTWDWIYGSYAEQDERWNEVISRIRAGYSKASIFLQLPMHGDCSVFNRIVDVPLVARKAGRTREEIRSILGVGAGERVILVTFTSIELAGEAYERIEKIAGVTFLYKDPLVFPLRGALKINAPELSYQEAVAAADAVLTKPGYGIVSDCVANATPMIYTERGPFPEYDVLVDTIRSELSSVFLDHHDFYAGNWEGAIRRVLSQPAKVSKMRIDGAEVCAREIMGFL